MYSSVSNMYSYLYSEVFLLVDIVGYETVKQKN